MARIPSLGYLGAGVASFLLCSTFWYFPFVGVFLAPAATLPVLFLRVQGKAAIGGWGWVVLLLLVATLLSHQRAFPLILLGTYVLVVVVPVSTAVLLESGYLTGESWPPAAVLLASLLVMALVIGVSSPNSPTEAASQWFDAHTEGTLELYREMGLSESTSNSAIGVAKPIFVWGGPSIAAAYVGYVVFWLRRRLELLMPSVGPLRFSSFRNPDWVVAGFVVSGAVALLLPGGTPRWVALNFFCPIVLLLFLQGLAVVRHYVEPYVGRGVLSRWSVGIIALQPPLSLILVFVGLVDWFRSLRPSTRKNDGGGEDESDSL